MAPAVRMLRRERLRAGFGELVVDDNGNLVEIDANGNLVGAPQYTIDNTGSDLSGSYEEPAPTATIDEAYPIAIAPALEVYDSSSRDPYVEPFVDPSAPPPDAYAYPSAEPFAETATMQPIFQAEPTTTYEAAPLDSFDLSTFGDPALLSVSSAGGVDHFAEYLPPGDVHEAQVRLAAWGRPRQYPSNGGPYGWDGPLVPGDFGLSGSDLDGVDSARVGLAIASFQRWANQHRNAGLPTSGMYTQATHAALVNETGAGLPTSFPTGGAPASVPGNVIPFPGSSGGAAGSPNVLGPSNPNTSSGTGAAPSSKPIPWLWIALVAAGAIFVVVLVVRKRRRSPK